MKKYALFIMLLLTSLIGFANPLPANVIFQLTARPLDSNTFILNWYIEKGYFLYNSSIKLNDNANGYFHLGRMSLPAALTKTTAQGNTYAIYRNELTLSVPVLGSAPGEAMLDVSYQGCSDEGFCYPPERRQIQLTINDKLALSQVNIEPAVETTSMVAKKTGRDGKLEALFSTNNAFLIIVSFFGFGLLLAFTPCVLPMIPVLSGIIVGHGNKLSTRKAFFLSLSYVLSMSVTYSLIGAVIAFMGNNLQMVMQSAWAVGLFSMLFIVLALSMFDVYELRLPVSWQARLASITRSQAGGHYLSAAIMGCLSILILSPCVTAPLIGALGYIANQGNVILGILALFFLSLGMGTPLLLIGTSAGKLLPKTGQWMNEVKSFFGVLLLAVALYLLDRLLPSILIMMLWASLLVLSGIYLGALRKPASNLEKFNQGVGLILMVYGFLILIGASLGHSNPLQPLKSHAISVNQAASTSVLTAKTVSDVQTALANAKREGKPVVIDFYADWCTSCKVIAATTLRDAHVRAAMNDFLLIKIDLTANNAENKALLDYYNVIAPPTFLFYDAQGHALEALQLVGEVSTDAFLDRLVKADPPIAYRMKDFGLFRDSR